MDVTKTDILKEIDYIGGALSIIGLTLFLVALQSGGYTHPWASAYVLCTLIIGLLLIVAFVAWEWKGATKPIIPKEIFAGQRIVGLAFGIAFISGMNFYSALNFFPILFTNVFEPTPLAIGTKSIAPAYGVTIGAVLINTLLSVFKNHNRELLLLCCVLMSMSSPSLASKHTLTTPSRLYRSTLSRDPRNPSHGRNFRHHWRLRRRRCPRPSSHHSNNRNPGRLYSHDRCALPCDPSYWWLHWLLNLLQRFRHEVDCQTAHPHCRIRQ